MSVSEGEDLIRMLVTLQRDKAWGTIDVDAGSTHTCIYVADGKPVFAEEGTLSDTLGRFLLREGVLSDTQYATILTRMTERLVESEPMRFGEVAVALGYLTVQQVHDALAAQIQQKVIRCLGQKQATFTFRASRDWTREVGRFPSDVEPLILHATETFDEERIEALLRVTEPAYARLVGDAGELAVLFHLGAGEARWLAGVDGKQSTRDLLAGGGEIETGPILCALLLSGHLALEARATPPAEPNMGRVSRPTQGARRRLILPPRISSKAPSQQEPSPESRAQAEATLRQLWETRRARTPVAPSPKTPQEARLLAEAAFQLGLGHLRTGALARAAQELRQAAELLPAATEYAFHAQWAEFANEQASLDETKRRAALKALVTSAEAILEQVPDLGFAYYVLGQVQLHEGHDEAARRNFRRAHRLDAELVDAERHLRLLEVRKRGSTPSKSELEGTETAVTVPVLAKIALKKVAVTPLVAATEISYAPEAPSSLPRSDKASAGDTEPEPEPVPAPEMPKETPPVAIAPPAVAARSRTGLLVVAVVLLVAIAFALGLLVASRPTAATRTPQTATVPTPTPAPTPTPTPKSPALAASLRDAELGASPPTPSASASATPTPSATATGDYGELTTGPSGNGHRLFVDGRSIGDGPGPFRVRCGAHTVQIGSQGKEHQVDVPCGGNVRVE